MYSILQPLHSWSAYLVVTLLIAVVFNSFFGFLNKRNFSESDKKLALFGLIFSHIQLILGLLLYFVSPLELNSLGQMSEATLRLTSMEHPLVGILAIVLITIGWSRHKKNIENRQKFKTIAIFYGLGLIFILSRIPWSLWF